MAVKFARPFPAAVWAAGRSLTNPRISPRGDLVAFISGMGERSEIGLIRLDGGSEQWLPCEPPAKKSQSSMDWLPDGSGLVYLGVDGCLHRIDINELRCQQLTVSPEPISGVAVSPDGTQVAYVVDTQHVAISPTEPDGPWPLRVSSGADFAFDPAWSPDGAWLAWHEWDVPNMPWDGSRIVVRRSDVTGPIITVAGGEGVAVQQPRFSPDGLHLAFLSDASGWLNLWVADVPSFDNARPLVEEAFEHGEPAWGPGQRSYTWAGNGDAIIFSRNDKGTGKLALCSLTAGETRGIAVGSYTNLHSQHGATVGIVSGAKRASELVSIDHVPESEGERESTLARGPLAGIERAGIDPEIVWWTSANDIKVPGRLYRTSRASAEAPPLLVWVHGGPHGQSMATLYSRWSYFLERGWSVLVPDYRGSSGWGRDHLQALRHGYGIVDVEDVAAGMEAAISNGWGARDKLVLFGGSSAGLTIGLMLARYPDLCAAGVLQYPLADLRSFNEQTWRFEAHYLDTLIGPLPDAYDEYVNRSPIMHASNIKAPVLILHGDSDNVVPVSQSHALAETIRRSGGTVEFHVYEGEGHGWRKPGTQRDELERIDGFLRRHVLHIPGTEERS